ncbi:hypothetical protein UlMin_000887 [Ulmus minor]
MGACCSREGMHGGFLEDEFDENENGDFEEDDIRHGHDGARIRLKGSSLYTSMYTQQGRKGINQDAMTVWENFAGEKDMYLCGVFDGHGPYGHKVARHVRDNLPAKLSKAIQLSKFNSSKYVDVDVSDRDYSDDYRDEEEDRDDNSSSDDNKDVPSDHSNNHNIISLSSWEACLIRSFRGLDEEISLDSTIDSYCSGSTAVTVVKQGDSLIIANLGDSRAVLCSRGDNNQLVPIQLTVDLKPDIPSEADRIQHCNGRVFAADEEPDVFRIWMPDEDCPGLAMARAFGDFCLKDYGLISIPDVSYRKLTPNDEFVVLATDGVWDALTNTEVIRIVASARKRCMAAKLVVKRALRAWKLKYPGSKVDDCAVVCLFLKDEQAVLTKSNSETIIRSKSLKYSSELACSRSFKSFGSDGASVSVGGESREEWNALDGVNRVNTIMRLPRFLSFGKSSKDFHEVEEH